MDRSAAFYSQPSYVGAGFPVFSGSRRQRGGSIFGAIARAVMPALKSVGKRALKTLGREGLGFASDVMKDVVSGKNVSNSLKDRGSARVKNVALKGVQGMQRALTPGVSKPSRKRTNTPQKQPPTKKRRRSRNANF